MPAKSHGCVPKRLYQCWRNMLNRCTNPNVASYKTYGARGIEVCEPWEQYVNFRDWAFSSGWEAHLTIDRIDSDMHYYPSNCQWLTREANIAKAKAKLYLVWEVGSEDKREIFNLSEFCRKNNITRRNLLQVAEGKRKSANGWQAKKLFNEA